MTLNRGYKINYNLVDIVLTLRKSGYKSALDKMNKNKPQQNQMGV